MNRKIIPLKINDKEVFWYIVAEVLVVQWNLKKSALLLPHSKTSSSGAGKRHFEPKTLKWLLDYLEEYQLELCQELMDDRPPIMYIDGVWKQL